MATLDEVRERIRTIDEELVDLVEKRVQAAREAGSLKRAAHRGVRDYDVERDVVDRFREEFQTRGLDAELGERIARVLIAEALRVQEADGLEPVKGPRGRALIVGGAGEMGAWFAHFLNGIGYEVIVNDTAGPLEGFAYTTDPRGAAEQVDLVILSTPPAITPDVVRELEGIDALLMDISSLKSPLVDPLRELAKAQPIVSLHPLWGPGTRVLSNKNILVLDCGNEDATRQAIELFELTAANIVELPIEEHDACMALTLGLPHLVNLAYAEVLSASGHGLEQLAQLGGPTFLKQTDVAAEVASENPELYRQIQALNDASPAIYAALHDAIDAIAQRLDDPEAFTGTMTDYNAWFDGFEGRFLP